MILVNGYGSPFAAQAFPCLGQLPEIIGGTVAESVAMNASSNGSSAWRSIGIGVTTGVLIWAVTRMLDKQFRR